MAAQAGLCMAGSETPEDTFYHVVAQLLRSWLIIGPVWAASVKDSDALALNSRSSCFRSAMQILKLIQATDDHLTVFDEISARVWFMNNSFSIIKTN